MLEKVIYFKGRLGDGADPVDYTYTLGEDFIRIYVPNGYIKIEDMKRIIREVENAK